MDKARILIIERSEPVRRLIEMVLTMAGQEVVHYPGCQQAWQKTAGEVFDLALADLSLERSAMESLLAALRHRSSAEAVPIIYLTASGRPEDLPFPGPVLHKPFGISELTSTAAHYLPHPLTPVAAGFLSFPAIVAKDGGAQPATKIALAGRWQGLLRRSAGRPEVARLDGLPRELQVQLGLCLYLLSRLDPAGQNRPGGACESRTAVAWRSVGLLLAEYNLPAFPIITAIVDLLGHDRRLSPGAGQRGEPTGADLPGPGLREDWLLMEITNRTMDAYLVYRDARLAMQTDALNWLSGEVSRAQEEERRRLSLEIHDDIAQMLGNLILLSDVCLSQTPSGNHELRDSLTRLKAIARDGFRRARSFSLDLRPPMLDDLGLVPTVAWYAERFTEEYGVLVRLQMPERLPPAPPEVETALFRILQEALTNVRKHAGAQSVRVTLERRDRQMRLVVVDDGAGFDVRQVRRGERNGEHLGLSGMQYRARLVGGTLRVISERGRGTTIVAEIPLPHQHSYLAPTA